jgi:signal transduction histidine kinase/CheY-like chemotaxis protein
VVERVPALLVDPRGRIIAVSRAAVSSFGLRPEAWIGQRLDDVLPPLATTGGDGAKRTTKTVERILGTVDGGAQRIVAGTDVPLPSGERWILLVDRTELHRLRLECVHLGQLASAGRLISGIVHEINNPLSGITGYVQLLLTQDHDRDTRVQLERIQSEASRASRIVRNLLDFARRRAAVASEPVELAAVIRKALELKAHELRVHNILVQIDVPAATPPVVADPHQLLQVFVNLIANAEQAMYEADRGGRIVVQARVHKGGEVVVRVRDTGPGVPDALRDRIFDDFFTTKSEGKGTGLGLGLCREILHRLDGSLHLVESGESGACFEIRLVAGETPRGTRAKRAARVPRVEGQRILLVEDDPVFRAFVAETFEAAGNEVHAFDRSDTALRFLRSRSVDAIISDVLRPGSNGIEFHAAVEKIDADLARRILLVTGDALNEDLARFVAESNVPVLAKPVQIDDLHASVGALLRRGPRRQRSLFGDQER